jgi:two-component system, cell cycle sensor histidine kinase and response regulator CckA
MTAVTQTILLVDDSLEDRMTYRRYLMLDKQHAYKILEAETGQEGLLLCQQHFPDVILLDYLLPDMDGLEFLDELKTQFDGASLPVIMLTGQGNEQIAAQTIKSGAAEYLIKKNLTPESLRLAIQYTIERQGALHQSRQIKLELQQAREQLEIKVRERTAELVQVNSRLQQEAERQRLVMEITQRIQKSLTLEKILTKTVEEVRQFLDTDRVIIFRFDPEWIGSVVAESVGFGWTSILSTRIYDPCFGQSCIEPFRQGCVTAKTDIYNAGIDRCHIEMLAKFQVRANLVVPIMQEENLWGLLIAHHCVSPRQWQTLEIDLLRQLAMQLGIAVQQAMLVEQLQNELEERKRAENELKKMSTALSNAVEGISQLDSQGRYLMVNQAYANAVGYKPEETIGMAWQRTVHPEDIDRMMAAYQYMLSNGKVEVEARGIRKDGSIFYKQLVMVASYDQQKQLTGHYCFMKDISDRKQMEMTLRESEEKFRILVTHAPVGIFQTDPQGDCLFVNDKWSELTGFSLDRAMGKGWIDAIHAEDRERVFEEWYDATQHKRAFFLEYRLQTPQGKVNWVVGSAVAIQNEVGEITGYFGTVTDISDRKDAEQKIREQAALLDIASDAIFVRDLDHQILFWNSGAERLYGWTAAEALGRKTNELMCKGVESETEQAFKTTIEAGLWQGELLKVTKSEKNVIINSRMTLVRDEAGNPKSILTVDTDITEKKQLETQFYRAQRLESLGTLASGISHDMNNVLTPILACAQLLPIKLPDLDEQNRRLLKIMVDNAKRGAELVKQILSFSRGEEGKRVDLQLQQLFAEIERIIRETFPPSIELQIDRQTQESLWTVSADPTQIYQVLMNLCVNARDAMPDGGILTISAENRCFDENYTRMNLDAKVGNYVVITVSDTGCGMSQEVKERIFDPFFTTKESGKGTGLGLATAIGIVKNHGGFVNVYSEVGKGSQFQVCLPVSNTAAMLVNSDSELVRGNGELILVVDDEAPIREITKTSLVNYNYKVLTAGDGVEAFSIYAQHRDEIALVLMDIQMPSISGLNAILVLRQMNPSIKIIAISGLVSNRKLLEDNDIEVQAFLSKPYTIKELLDTIHTAIGQLNKT